jgi:hypothetical protein
MSQEKQRFSARVRVDTLACLDEQAEQRGLTRSQTIERIVDEWNDAQEQPDGTDSTDRFARFGEYLAGGAVILALLAGVAGLLFFMGVLPGSWALPLSVALGVAVAFAGGLVVISVAMLATVAHDTYVDSGPVGRTVSRLLNRGRA